MKFKKFCPSYEQASLESSRYIHVAKKFERIMKLSFDKIEEFVSSKEFKNRIVVATTHGDLEDSIQERDDLIKNVKQSIFKEQIDIAFRSLRLDSEISQVDLNKLKQHIISLYERTVSNFSLDQQKDIFEKGLNIIVRQALYKINYNLAESEKPQKFRKLKL